MFYPQFKVDSKKNQIIASGLCCPPSNVSDEKCFFINTNNEKFLIEQTEFLPEPHGNFDWFFQDYVRKNARRFKFTFEKKNLDKLVKSGISINFGSKKTLEPFRIEDTFFYKEDNLSMPPSKSMLHVSRSASPTAFWLTGFSIFTHLNRILKKHFNLSFTDFKNICDWGCGFGRLEHFITKFNEIQLTGLDIDYENIDWCQKRFPNSSFFVIKPEPPVNLKENEFDLIIGISIFTHLKEKPQFKWLEELKRLAKKGAPVIMTINSNRAWVLTRQVGKNALKEFDENGIYDKFPNNQLEKLNGNFEYVNTFHTHQYIEQNWGKYFEIIDIIVGGIGGYQDVVVMKKK